MVMYCQKASEDAGHSDSGPRVLMLELLTVSWGFRSFNNVEGVEGGGCHMRGTTTAAYGS